MLFSKKAQLSRVARGITSRASPGNQRSSGFKPFLLIWTGCESRSLPSRVHHRYLELCVISQVANELKSGDLCSPLGDKFRDYRQQLVAWDQFEREVSAYGDQTGIPTEARPFVQSLQEKLIATSRNTDERFPQNESVRIENGSRSCRP